MSNYLKWLAAAVSAIAILPTVASAASYPAHPTITGTNVSFVLNEGGATLTYSINNGPQIPLDGTTAGTKTFDLTAITDSFTITALRTDSVGYRVPTGTTTPPATGGLSQPTANGGFRLISDDTNPLFRFNSPRGLSVNNSPNTGALFGTAYVSNSAAGTVAASGNLPARTLGDGLYAVRANGTDAFGYGDTAQNPGGTFDGASPSSPWRASVSSDGNVHVADFSDSRGNAYVLNSNLTTAAPLLAGIGGPTILPAGQNHGSTYAVQAVPGAGGALTLYTLDEDLTTTQFPPGTGTSKNHLWRYDIPAGGQPFAGVPTKVNPNDVLVTGASSDLHIGRVDGKFYLGQNRSAGAESGVFVLNPDGTTAFSSLAASRILLNDPAAVDILRNVQGIAVSEDQKFLAAMLNNSDVAVIPLVDGIPDLANRLLIDTGTDINSGRDIAFDAAGNIHYVSSGQGLYRILSPGGEQFAMLSYSGGVNGVYAFTTVNPVPEPTCILGVGLAGTALYYRRRAKSRRND